jgi:rubrerythrin
MLTPTALDLATTKAAPMTCAPPPVTVTDELLRQRMADTGLSPTYTADLLSAFLTHERCGRHLYRSVAGRTNNPVLKARYEAFGEETERHVDIYEQLIQVLGGDPAYVSPMARAVEMADSKTLESTFLLGGSVDVMVQESLMLDAVLLAEAMCHANWQAIGKLCEAMDAGPLQDQVRAAYDEVEAEEDEHLSWATDMRSKLILLQADHSAVAAVGQKVEEAMATVRGWFS